MTSPESGRPGSLGVSLMFPFTLNIRGDLSAMDPHERDPIVVREILAHPCWTSVEPDDEKLAALWESLNWG